MFTVNARSFKKFPELVCYTEILPYIYSLQSSSLGQWHTFANVPKALGSVPGKHHRQCPSDSTIVCVRTFCGRHFEMPRTNNPQEQAADTTMSMMRGRKCRLHVLNRIRNQYGAGTILYCFLRNVGLLRTPNHCYSPKMRFDTWQGKVMFLFKSSRLALGRI